MSEEQLDEPDIKKQALTGFKWVALGKGVATAYSFIITLMMVRLLAPADYGMQAMWEPAIELAALLGVFCLDQSLVRHKVRDKRILAELFGILILTNAFAAIVLLVLAPYIAAYFKVEELARILRVMSLLIIIAPLRVIPNALLDSQMKFKMKAQIEIASIILASTLGIFMAYLGLGVWALVFTMLTDAFLKIVLMALRNPWIIRPRFTILYSQSVVRYALRMMGAAAAVLIGAKATSVVAGPILGAELMGLYTVAITLALLPMVKLMPIMNQVLFPTFANIKNVEVRSYYLKILQISSIIVFPVAVGMAVTAGLIVTVVLGSQWASLVALLASLAVLTPVRMISQFSYTVLNASGSARRVANITVGVALTNILLLYPATLLGGLYGLIALSYALRILEYGLTVRALNLELGVRLGEQLDSLKAAAMSSCVMVLVLFICHLMPNVVASEKIQLAAHVLIGAAVYCASLALFFGAQMKALIRLIHNKRVRPQ